MYFMKKSQGFTMVELLVVMTIIAILVGISLVSFDNIRKSARDGKRKADLESVRSALEIYRTDCKTYPTDSEIIFDGNSTLTGPADNAYCANVEYIAKVPSDTSPNAYYYKKISANSYILCAHLENSTALAVVACGSNCGGTCNHAVYNP